MASTHGSDTYISIAAADVSTYCNTSTFTLKADAHKTTGYGANSNTYGPGLKDGTFSMGGTYDNTAAGPHDVIKPLIGTTVEVVRRPEGTGTGRPQETFSVIVTSYVETNPVADMVSWSSECQITGDVADTNQA